MEVGFPGLKGGGDTRALSWWRSGFGRDVVVAKLHFCALRFSISGLLLLLLFIPLPEFGNRVVDVRNGKVFDQHADCVLPKDDPYGNLGGVAVDQPDADWGNQFADQVDSAHRAVELLSIDIQAVRHDDDPVSFYRHRVGYKSKFLKASKKHASAEQCTCDETLFFATVQHEDKDET